MCFHYLFPPTLIKYSRGGGNTLHFACPYLLKKLKACIQVGQLKFILKFKEIGAVDLNSFFADPDLVILDADPDPAYKNPIKKFKNKFLNYLKLFKTITHFFPFRFSIRIKIPLTYSVYENLEGARMRTQSGSEALVFRWNHVHLGKNILHFYRLLCGIFT